VVVKEEASSYIELELGHEMIELVETVVVWREAWEMIMGQMR
jgi:hypothetical protein